MGKQSDLDAARAARAAVLASGQASYRTVLGGEVKYLSLTELNGLIAQLEGEVAIEGLVGVDGPSRIEIGLGGIQRAM